MTTLFPEDERAAANLDNSALGALRDDEEVRPHRNRGRQSLFQTALDYTLAALPEIGRQYGRQYMAAPGIGVSMPQMTYIGRSALTGVAELGRGAERAGASIFEPLVGVAGIAGADDDPDYYRPDLSDAERSRRLARDARDARDYAERTTTEWDRSTDAMVNAIAPDPEGVDPITGVLGGVARILPPALIGGALGGPIGAATLSSGARAPTAYEEQIASGVDPETARTAAAIDAAYMGAMTLLPASVPVRGARFDPRAFALRAGSGVALNVPTGMAMRGSIASYLEGAGYPEQARNYDWLDATAIATDAILGAVFGGFMGEIRSSPGGAAETATIPALSAEEHIEASVRLSEGENPDPVMAYAHARVAALMGEPEGAARMAELVETHGAELAEAGDTVAAIMAVREGLVRPDRALVDDAMVARDARHAEVDAAPGVPLNHAARAQHGHNLAQAHTQARAGEEISVGNFSEDAEFAPHADDIDAMQADIEYAREAIRRMPMRLTEWVRRQGEIRDAQGRLVSRGGIADDRGDVAGGAGDGRKGFASLLSPNGRSLDDLALSAWEQGFFPEATERPTINEFIDALDQDARDPGSVSNDMEGGYAARNAKQVLDFYESQGVDTAKSGDDLREDLARLASVERRTYDVMAEVLEDEGFADLARDIAEERRRLGLSDDEPLFSFGGRKARTADAQALRQAQEMLKVTPEDSERIRRETGWFLGPDSKWRFEIDDSSARVDESVAALLLGQRKAKVKLGALLQHDLLYAAYPWLRDVTIERGGSGEASIVPGLNKIELGYDRAMPRGDALRGLLLHEIQHLIQHREGFQGGSNPEAFGEQVERDGFGATLDRHPSIRTAFEESAQSGWHENFRAAYALYSRVLGEVEARDVTARADLSPEERRDTSPAITREYTHSPPRLTTEFVRQIPLSTWLKAAVAIGGSGWSIAHIVDVLPRMMSVVPRERTGAPVRYERWSPPEGVHLSARERETVEMAVNGASNAWIAEAMDTSAHVVGSQLAQIKARLGGVAPWESGYAASGRVATVPIAMLLRARKRMQRGGIPPRRINARIAEQFGLTPGNVRQRLWQYDRRQSGEPQFSAGQSRGFFSVEDLQSFIASDLGLDWARASEALRLDIVPDAATLRQVMGEAGYNASQAPDGVQGVHLRGVGRTLLVADALNPEDVMPVLIHEIGYHHGMADMLGAKGMAELDRHLARLVREGHPLVMHAMEEAARASTIDNLAEEVGAYTVENAQRIMELAAQGRLSEAPPQLRAAALAKLIETSPDLPLVSRLLANLRQWLIRKFGTTFGMRLTVNDIRELAVASLNRALERGVRESQDVRVLGLPNAHADELASARAQGYEGSDTGEAVEWLRAKASANLLASARGRPAPRSPFYSGVERALEQSTTARASGAQWWATISRAPGVKKEELERIGLEDWLKARDEESAAEGSEQHRSIEQALAAATERMALLERGLEQKKPRGYQPKEEIDNPPSAGISRRAFLRGAAATFAAVANPLDLQFTPLPNMAESLMGALRKLRLFENSRGIAGDTDMVGALRLIHDDPEAAARTYTPEYLRDLDEYMALMESLRLPPQIAGHMRRNGSVHTLFNVLGEASDGAFSWHDFDDLVENYADASADGLRARRALEKSLPRFLGRALNQMEIDGLRQQIDDLAGELESARPGAASKPASISREDVLAFVRANGVSVEETVLGGENPGTRPLQAELLPLLEERQRLMDEHSDIRRNAFGGRPGDAEVARLNEITQRLNEIKAPIADLQRRLGEVQSTESTKWSQYTLPGGKNYRELLLRLPLPERPGFQEYLRAYRARYPNATTTDAEVRQFHNQGVPLPDGDAQRFQRVETSGDVFRSSHFDQPNILVHVRFNERTDAQGRRTLFIEELQSDWHQAGRERGYRDGDNPALRAELDRILLDSAWSDPTFGYTDKEVFLRDMASPERQPAAIAALRNLGGKREHIEALQRAVNAPDSRVPDAPFKNNAWAALALKRMIRWAAENGFDQIAWIPGHVKNGKVEPDGRASTLELSADGSELRTSERTYRIVERNPREGGRTLVSVVENDIAKQLLAQEPIASGPLKGVRRLEGDFVLHNVQGWEFYDRILVNIANDLGKKFGARVGEARVETDERPPWTFRDERVETQAGVEYLRALEFWREDIGSNMPADYMARSPKEPREIRLINKIRDIEAERFKRIERGRTRGAGAGGFNRDVEQISHRLNLARQELAEHRATAEKYPVREQTVHALPITDAMRDAAMDGQALFSARGGQNPPGGVGGGRGKSDPVSSPEYRAQVDALRASDPARQWDDAGAIPGDGQASAGETARGLRARRGAIIQGVLVRSGVRIARTEGGVGTPSHRISIDAPFEIGGELGAAIGAQRGESSGPTHIEFDFIDGNNPKDPRLPGVHLRLTRVNDALKGMGVGTWLYRQLIDWADRQGLSVYSDAIVSDQAQGVYARLEELGYKVEGPAPRRREGDGHITLSGRPMYVVKSYDVQDALPGAPMPRNDYAVDGPSLRERIAQAQADDAAYSVSMNRAASMSDADVIAWGNENIAVTRNADGDEAYRMRSRDDAKRRDVELAWTDDGSGRIIGVTRWLGRTARPSDMARAPNAREVRRALQVFSRMLMATRVKLLRDRPQLLEFAGATGDHGKLYRFLLERLDLPGYRAFTWRNEYRSQYSDGRPFTDETTDYFALVREDQTERFLAGYQAKTQEGQSPNGNTFRSETSAPEEIGPGRDRGGDRASGAGMDAGGREDDALFSARRDYEKLEPVAQVLADSPNASVATARGAVSAREALRASSRAEAEAKGMEQAFEAAVRCASRHGVGAVGGATGLAEAMAGQAFGAAAGVPSSVGVSALIADARPPRGGKSGEFFVKDDPGPPTRSSAEMGDYMGAASTWEETAQFPEGYGLEPDDAPPEPEIDESAAMIEAFSPLLEAPF